MKKRFETITELGELILGSKEPGSTFEVTEEEYNHYYDLLIPEEQRGAERGDPLHHL
jgi:NOL1/NOP2/fmu family ribosome biogenesis protein